MSSQSAKSGGSFVEVWRKKVPFAFSTLLIGKPFRESSTSLLVGTTDGKVRILEGQQNDAHKQQQKEMLETKGSCVQALLLFDVAKFGSNDLLVGDSDGNITIFSDNEILSKFTLSNAVTSLEIDRDANNNYSIVAGDKSGVLASLKPHDLQWKVRLSDDPQCSSDAPNDIAIRCLLSTKIRDKIGSVCSVLLLSSSNSNKLHVYSQGTRLLSVIAPSRITSLCLGRFLLKRIEASTSTRDSKRRKLSEQYEEKGVDEDGEESSKDEDDILVGCDDGFVYSMSPSTYKLTRFVKVGFAPLKMSPLSKSSPQQSDSHRSDSSRLDYLVCSGQFNTLKLYYNGELVAEKKMNDWVRTFSVGDVDDDRENEIVVGTTSNELICYKIQQ
eukprot:TRINITY_DN1487_c0_g1_i1.p1 TRINITY_DN1487_c0_g1~~TRINITY_DN1487_c0_g1_i1.p1  ORF type:complete len:385 (-),score=83.92 TRINITY_DN1487_c0_g1_i1:1209-2363(-)